MSAHGSETTIEAEFRTLGLTLGHWAALAPVPALLHEHLGRDIRGDITTLHALRRCLGGEDHLRVEAQGFWAKIVDPAISAGLSAISHALLAWHLAWGMPRDRRENFLHELDDTARRFRRSSPSASVRGLVERYLPVASYTRNPPPLHVSPPDPAGVGRLLGVNLWKQMLMAPVAAALVDHGTTPGNVFPLVSMLAHVTKPGTAEKPYPLEPHLTPGWLQLFAGLLDPMRRDTAKALVEPGIEVAARGLASLPFAERESLLAMIRNAIVQPLITASDREGYAAACVDALRVKIEGHFAGGLPLPPEPSEETLSPLEPSPLVLPVAPLPVPTPALVTPTKPPPGPAILPVPLPAPQRPAVVVEKARDFTTVTFDDAMTQARGVTVAQVGDWLAAPENAARFLFDPNREHTPEVAIVRDPAAVPKTLWVVGDLHADVLTLANIIAHADRVGVEENEPPAFLFLGDFVDRGRHDHETLLLLFALIMRNPAQVCIVPGNHDVDLRWGEVARRFGVSIEPAEYCEGLNRNLESTTNDDQERIALGKLFIEFCKTRPKAVFLPDGTMFAHGGFPHTDLHESLRTPADLGAKKYLDDFLWARISDGPKKRPNRGNRGHEFGWRDFAEFCRVMNDRVKVPVRRLIRGHDHIPTRWQLLPEYEAHPVLTINAMGRKLDAEPAPADGPHPFPVVVRYTPDRPLLVVRLPLDAAEVDRAFGKVRLATSPELSFPESEPVPESPLPNPGDVSGDIPDESSPDLGGYNSGVRLVDPPPGRTEGGG